MSEELKPCPFCGSSATLTSTPADDKIECDLCGAQVFGPTVPVVRLKWSTRQPAIEVTDEMVEVALSTFRDQPRVTFGSSVDYRTGMRAALVAALTVDP